MPLGTVRSDHITSELPIDEQQHADERVVEPLASGRPAVAAVDERGDERHQRPGGQEAHARGRQRRHLAPPRRASPGRSSPTRPTRRAARSRAAAGRRACGSGIRLSLPVTLRVQHQLRRAGELRVRCRASCAGTAPGPPRAGPRRPRAVERHRTGSARSSSSRRRRAAAGARAVRSVIACPSTGRRPRPCRRPSRAARPRRPAPCIPGARSTTCPGTRRGRIARGTAG